MLRRGTVSYADNTGRLAAAFFPDLDGMVIDVKIASGVPDLEPGDTVYVAFIGHSVEDAVIMDKEGPRQQTETGATYVYTQIAQSAIWRIEHGLNKYPSVTIVEAGGSTIIGDVSYESNTTVVVSFTIPVTGRAYLN